MTSHEFYQTKEKVIVYLKRTDSRNAKYSVSTALTTGIEFVDSPQEADSLCEVMFGKGNFELKEIKE